MNSDDTTTVAFVDQAKAAYGYSMDNMLYGQAVFYANALQAESYYSGEAAVLLAKALYMDGQVERAMETLSPFARSPDAPISHHQTLPSSGHILFAKCCVDLDKCSEAVTALYGRGAYAPDKVDVITLGAPGLFVLGRALERVGDRTGAADCYSKCLQLCPIMFEAFERLSALSFDNPKVQVPPNRFAKTFFEERAIADCLPVTEPSATGDRVSAVSPSNLPIPPSVLTGTPTKLPNRLSIPRPPTRGVPATPPPARRRALSPPTISKPSGNAAKTTTSTFTFTDYLVTVGSAIHALNGFDVNVVVDYLSRLPHLHQETALVQGLLGRAFTEAGRFSEAESAFGTALKLCPSGIIDVIDVYSSVLWQLRKEPELAHLCTHGLRVGNRAKSYKLWIAVGNSFSLQKEPETALKFIARCVQINPNFAYAHVLMGHEFYAQDKFDKAKQCYTRAIELDPRCYNAFWGMGQTYLRQEEFANAKFNFIKALEINPKSSTVRYSLAAVASAMRENDLAYQQLALAIELNPLNAPALCQKGLLEMTVYRQAETARETLEQALAVAPQEPVIYVLLGKIFANGGRRTEAMNCYNTALELLKGSKDNYGLKQSIEELDFVGQPEAGGQEQLVA